MLGTYFGQTYFGQGYPALPVGVPDWVSPVNHVSFLLGTEALVATVPQAVAAVHFELQLATSPSFASPTVYRSWTNQVGWEYYDGASWQPLPTGGVDPAYAGQQVRYTGATLAPATYYRRIRARTKT
jgi:hypothetical protein